MIDSNEMRKAVSAAILAIQDEYDLSGDEDDDYVYDTLGSNMAGAYFKLRAAMFHANWRPL